MATKDLPKGADHSRFVIYSPHRGVFMRETETGVVFAGDANVVVTSKSTFPTYSEDEAGDTINRLSLGDCDGRPRECNPAAGRANADRYDLANHGIPATGGV